MENPLDPVKCSKWLSMLRPTFNDFSTLLTTQANTKLARTIKQHWYPCVLIVAPYSYIYLSTTCSHLHISILATCLAIKTRITPRLYHLLHTIRPIVWMYLTYLDTLPEHALNPLPYNAISLILRRICPQIHEHLVHVN